MATVRTTMMLCALFCAFIQPFKLLERNHISRRVENSQRQSLIEWKRRHKKSTSYSDHRSDHNEFENPTIYLKQLASDDSTVLTRNNSTSSPHILYATAIREERYDEKDQIKDSANPAPAAVAVESHGDPFELGEDGELAKPEMLISDWIEMFLFAILLLIGVPLNAIALTRLLQAWNFGRCNLARTKQEVTRTNFLWLKIHLTVIDLLVIVCYCPSHIAWLISYTWYGGEFLCKAMQYSWDFCFHLMSFGVVGIAVDRLRTVYGLMRMEKTGRMVFQSSNQLQFVRRLIVSCYIGAAIFSIPQWFVWTTIDMRTWSQCTTIWHKVRALQYLQDQAFTESFEGERIYTLVHLLTVFWIPFLILFVAYCYIMVHLFYYSISTGNSIRSMDMIISDESTNERFSVSLWSNQMNAAPAPDTNTNNRKCSSDVAHVTNEKNVPAWRREMRSRMFRVTVLVIAAYLICWMPYNLLSLATFFSQDLQVMISTHLELLRVCVLLNTLLNPFIYGFNSVTQA